MKLICCLCISLGASCAAFGAGAQSLTMNAEEVERLGVQLSHPRRVSMVEMATGPAEIVIPPAQEVVVSAMVAGVVTRLLVAEGESVQAGQSIAEIQSPGLLGLQREFVNALTANDLAAAQLRRDRELYGEGIIAERRLLEAEAAARAASVALDQRRQQLRLAGMTDQFLASLAEDQQLSTVLILRAPLDGIITELLNGLGEQVDSLDPVYRVADLSSLWIEVRISPEHALPAPGDLSVAVMADGHELLAPVVHVGQVVDSTSQTIVVRAAIENHDSLLRAGQFLAARVLAPTNGSGVLAVPISSIVREGSETFVFVRSANGFELHGVQMTAADGVQAYISSGLVETAEIAVDGVASLRSAWFASQAGDE